MRTLVRVVLLLISAVVWAGPGCRLDPAVLADQLYPAQLVLVVRAANSTAVRGGQAAVRVGRVLRGSVPVQPGLPVSGPLLLQLPAGPPCRLLRPGRRYLVGLVVSSLQDGWRVAAGPVPASRRWRRLVRDLASPALQPLSATTSVGLFQWVSLSCQLTTRYPAATLSWWRADGSRLGPGPAHRLRLRARRAGTVSVLRVRGEPGTAGRYWCRADSTAGSTNISTTLWVHGGAAAACDTEFCLAGGRCSLTRVGGALQPVCSCPAPYTGLRCERKTVSLGSVPSTLAR